VRYSPKHALVKVANWLPLWAKIAVPTVASAALAVGGLAYSAGAGAATNACGSNCVDISFLSTGPHWLLNDSRGSHAVNATVSQQEGSNGGNQGRNEDFEYYGLGTLVPDYCTALGAPAASSPFTDSQCEALVNSTPVTSQVFELEYYPYGGDGSGLCVSAWDGQFPVPSGYKTRLQPCGQNVDSVLIGATALDGGKFHATPGSLWVISGGSDNFSHPVVLTNNGIQQWQNLTWATVETDGNGGVVNQEISPALGAY
jgi:hypothetical protein